MGKVIGMPWKGRAYLHKKYPGAFPLSESQIKVLEGLARNGPMNTNKLRKKTGNSYSFVYCTLKELERRKMVALLRKERTEKGTDAYIYDLALEGILLVLQREMQKADFDTWDHAFIGKIIDKYSYTLPMVFGKWKYFKEAGVGRMIFSRLKIAVDTHKSEPFRRGTGFYPWLETEQQITRFFFLWDFYRLDDNPIPGFDFRVWMTALKKDEEIRAYVIQELEYDQRRLKSIQIVAEKAISFLKSPKEAKLH